MNSDLPNPPVAPAEPAPSAPACILVVDDQPANIQVVGSVLGRLGHEIIPASDGPTALRRLALRPPDLILLDLLMPEMDGCEVCRRLRQNPEWRDIPVIFLSAADDENFIVRALESGGVDYITKPFNQAELVSRVRTQLALKSARDRLAQLAKDKDELIGILTHDLKSHLGGINMSAKLLHDRILRQEGDDRSRQLTDNIYRSSGQVLEFVKEFLANAATDHGFTLKPVRVNFSAAAHAAVQQFREMARQKGLEILYTPAAEDVIVWADPMALDQVLDNLVSNALKFSPPGKKIFVTVAAEAEGATCRIRDEGPGFLPEDRPRLFQRYARLSARPTAGEPSTGLGLSIVWKLVQAMHGELICDSTPGEGATFTVRLRPTEDSDAS